MKSLTDKQNHILNYLKDYLVENGHPPSVREIGANFGMLWSAARQHLKAIEKKGFIRIHAGKSRAIEIVNMSYSNMVSIPLLGNIRAGLPMTAVQEYDTNIVIDKTLFPERDTFALRVNGDSMIGAGIFNGDLVIVKKQPMVCNGDIAVAIIGDEATVKRVFYKGDAILLKPENPQMQDIVSKDALIIGKVIGVIRKL